MNNYYNFRGQDMMKQYNPNNYKEEKNSLYEPYQGFIRGNLYKDLYDPYKVNGPYEIKPMNEQAELLTYIDALCFACTDLNLYLDVYPDNKDIIKNNELTGENLNSSIEEIVLNREKCKKMGKNAGKLANTDVESKIYKEIELLVKN